MTIIMEEFEDEQDHGCCSSCHLVLKQPFINCKTSSCGKKVQICLECFSRGREFGKHKKSHKYSIVFKDFSILDESWTASEEVKLLEALLNKGEGNWDEISRLVSSKSPLECQRHYENHYIDNDDFPDFNTEVGLRQDQPVIFAPSESNVIRPQNRSVLHKDLAGYNAARGDFDWESDNLAEMELNVIEANDDLFQYVAEQEDLENCDMNEDNLLTAALSASALQVHNQRLKRRLRRKRIVKEFGLLNKPRSMSLSGRYPLISNAKYDHIFKLGPRVQCSLDFDFLVEGLEHELGVRQTILRLQDYRTNGIRQPLAAAFYTKLRNQREAEVLERPKETILDFVRSAKAKRKGLSSNPLMTMTTRRSAGPLDILGLPCYEKLNEDERDLCSEARVLPEVFLDIKKILTEECEKSGGLRLADARPLVKIDVNKTRKLYDYLLKKELIYPPNPTKK